MPVPQKVGNGKSRRKPKKLAPQANLNSIPRLLLLIERIQKPSEPSNVLRQLSRPFGNVIVPSIGNPPRISFQVIWSCLVQSHSLSNGNLLVQTTVYDHNRALGLSNAIDVGVNVETSQGAARVVKCNQFMESVRNGIQNEPKIDNCFSFRFVSFKRDTTDGLTGSVSALAFHS